MKTILYSKSYTGKTYSGVSEFVAHCNGLINNEIPGWDGYEATETGIALFRVMPISMMDFG